jgi:chemotaxis protein CheX
MDVSYVNPFISATINVFKTMLRTEIRAASPKLKAQPYPSYDVSGIIGLSGDAQGSIALSFPKLLALKIVSTMLGADIKVIGPEITDGIGELANIVAGNAKQDLSRFNMSISLPNVVIGKNHILTAPSGSPTMVVPFSCGLGEFAMEVSLKTK